MTKSAIYCEHANEVPQACPCPPDCYCRDHTCKNRVLTPKYRIAFAGASGTGKTTLSNHLIEKFKLPFNPVGSRSVSKAMGFESPYDVDKAGKRAEFQRRLVTEKRAWEDAQVAFVTDRTTLDNLAYTMFHDVSTIDEALLDEVVGGLHRYTHVVYCPVAAFCNPADDTARVKDMTYHRLYDATIKGLLDRFLPKTVRIGTLDVAGRDARQGWLTHFLGAGV